MKGKLFFDIRNIARIIFAILAIWICIRFSKECARGILDGILFCIEVTVPSLFFFMTASAYLVKSGAARALTKPLDRISRFLFRLPYPALTAILTALVGGYPTGARCAAMLCEEGELSREQAEKTAIIAVGAGPGFILSFIGSALLGSPPAGAILLAAQIIGTLMTGIIAGRMIKCGDAQPNPTKTTSKNNLIIESVTDASKAVFAMCSMIVLCSAVTQIVAAISSYKALTDICTALLEITAGCAAMCGHYPMALIAFFTGFGGISVHLQIYAAMGDIPLRKGLFFLYRILQGIITSAAAYILLLVFPVEFRVFNSVDLPLTAANYATIAGSAALILCCLCFLGSVRNIRQHRMISGTAITNRR